MAHHSIHYSQPFALDLLTLCKKFWSQLLQDPGWSFFLGKLRRERLVGQTTSPGTAPGLKVATDIHCLLYNPFLALLCRWLIWQACGYHASLRQ